MKFLFTLLFVIGSYVSFGQISLNDLISVYKMDFDQFETFSLNKGYTFEKTEDTEDVFRVCYVRGTGLDTKYLSLYSKFYLDGTCVIYQTSRESDYLKFKDQMSAKGLRLTATENFDGSLKKVYKNREWEVNIYSGIGSDELPYYEISLVKPRKD